MYFFWQLFRLVFVLFSLYLMGDVFYRWDGFSYYASFSEFLPSVALIFTLCSIVAVITAIAIWLLLIVFKWLCQLIGWRINEGNLLLFISCLALSAAIALLIKHYLIGSGSALHTKIVVLLSVISVTSYLTWILRGKFNIISERITPLVWLFGAIVMISVPLVFSHVNINKVTAISNEYSQDSTTENNRKNIILVTFDALYARHMSLYGYKRDTTPFISKWAENASVFTNMKTSDGHTTPATTSLMTGQRVWTHQTYHLRSEISKNNIATMPSLLKKNGYYTIAYIENLNASPKGLNIFESFNYSESFIPEDQHLLSRFHSLLFRLFYGNIKLYDWILLDDFHPTALFRKHLYYPYYFPIYKKTFIKRKKILRESSITVLDRFINDINDNYPPKPFFVWLHIMPPHDPYVPPEPFLGTFDSSSELRTNYKQRRTFRKLLEHRNEFGHFLLEDLKPLKTLEARYDENILYCDKAFEDFIQQLKTKNLLSNTVIMLSSDHGESFEHDYIGHGGHLYEPVMHIPFIVKYQNQSSGLIINDLSEQIDIPATILDIANLSIPFGMEGRSLVPLMQNNKLPPKTAFSMHLSDTRSGDKIDSGMFAIWKDNFKLIHYLTENKSLLFNLKQDPEEMDDLFNKQPEKGQHLLRILRENLKRANQKISNNE